MGAAQSPPRRHQACKRRWGARREEADRTAGSTAVPDHRRRSCSVHSTCSSYALLNIAILCLRRSATSAIRSAGRHDACSFTCGRRATPTRAPKHTHDVRGIRTTFEAHARRSRHTHDVRGTRTTFEARRSEARRSRYDVRGTTFEAREARGKRRAIWSNHGHGHSSRPPSPYLAFGTVG